MNSVTNAAPGARVINAKIGETGEGDKKQAVVQLVHLAPGETADVEILNADDPVFKGMVDRGELIVGAKGEKPLTPEQKAQKDRADAAAQAAAREAAAHKAGFDEGFAKATADAKAAEDAKAKK